MFISFRDSPHCFHITIGKSKDNDKLLFFGQDEFKKDSRDVYFHFEDTQTWDDIAVFLKLWPSKSQARKNGWEGKIPWGYSELHKKKTMHFYILNFDPADSRTAELEI